MHCDSATLSARSRTQQSLSLSSAEAELNALTSGTADGMVTKHFLKEVGYEMNLENHVDSQPAKARAPERGLRRMKHAHVCARCRGEEANDSCLCKHEVAQSRLEDTVTYIQSAHERMRNAGSETLQRRRISRFKPFEVM